MVLKARFSDNEHGVPHYMKLTGRPLSLMVSVISTCGFLLFGYDQGVMAGLISATDFNNQFPQTRANSVWQAFVTAIYEVYATSSYLRLVEASADL